MADRSLPVQAALLGVAGHTALCAVVAAAGAGHVRTATPRVVLVPVVAAAVAVLVTRAGAGPTTLVVATAASWFAAGMAHHYLVGITPSWGSEPVRGLEHLAWDLAFHAPPVLLAAVGRRTAAQPARTGAR